jgi:hypothetical protein
VAKNPRSLDMELRLAELRQMHPLLAQTTAREYAHRAAIVSAGTTTRLA